MEKIEEIFTDRITLPPNNMREHIDRDEIFELAEDIKKNGLISPITVRPKNGLYELVAGQRRYLAHQVGGILKIKCQVRQLTDEEAFAIMTSENLARVDVNPVDEAKHIGRLLEVHAGDIKKVSQIVRRGEQWIKDRLAVSQMPDYMQEFLARKEMKLGVALALVQITNENDRRVWVEMAVRDGVSVAQADFWLHGWQMNQLPGGTRSEIPPEGYVPGAPQPVMFECAVDGKKYDSRLMKSFFVYEQNLAFFNEVVASIRETPDEK